jgi:hypothetical protein
MWIPKLVLGLLGEIPNYEVIYGAQAACFASLLKALFEDSPDPLNWQGQ